MKNTGIHLLLCAKYKLVTLLGLILIIGCTHNSRTNISYSSNYIPIINSLLAQGHWKEAIDLAKINLHSAGQFNEKDEINLYALLGENYRFFEKYDLAERYFQKVVDHPRANIYPELLGEAYYGLGDLCYLDWSYFKQEESLEIARAYLDSAMINAKKSNNLKLKSKTLYRQGTILQIQGNKEDSEKCFNEGLSISFSISDTIGMIRNNTHIGAGLKKSGSLDSALVHYNRSYDLAKSTNRNYSEAHALCNLGSLYIDKEELSKAKEYFTKAKYVAEELNHRIVMCRSYYGLSLVEEKLGNLTEAAKYASIGLDLARKKGYLNFEHAFVSLIKGLSKNNKNSAQQ